MAFNFGTSRSLSPSDDNLSQKVVLAQAWKKSHEYIRSTNWYADTFELDRSAINLESLLDDWIAEIKNENFSFRALKLIPAPKADRWGFVQLNPAEFVFGGKENNFGLSVEEQFSYLSYVWVPNEADDSKLKPLRPLAHVSIRDQTIMTALMMCLAENVESAQGDTSTDFQHVHEKRICSYGNRLYCHYEDGLATFNWGNSVSYSKYFADYRQFLARPAYFGYEALQSKSENEHVYEVHLDIEKFFDRAQRRLLIENIRRFLSEKDEIPSNILRAFENWQWAEGTNEVYHQICTNHAINEAPLGIPQGLVAGGFLSNVYLLEFDEWLLGNCDTFISESVRLVDYCRYVDDIRLILVSSEDRKTVSDKLYSILEPKLALLDLSINHDKTKIEIFRSKRPGISFKLKEIQTKVSGPLSTNEIDEQLGHLEGLISLAESLRTDSFDSSNSNSLALVESAFQDVREDTLLRFSTNKIHALLKQKRSMVAQEIDEFNNPIPGSWDYLQERMARKFIACWSKNPSLVLLLKKGLELFPDKRLLNPVVEQLKWVRKRNSKKQIAIAEYCLCEIFRHSATIIHVKDKWAHPAHAKVEDFFEVLQELAVDILSENELSDSHLSQQARFILVVRNDGLGDSVTNDKNFDLVTKLIKGYRRVSPEQDINEFVINSILAYQVAYKKELVLRSVDSFLNKLEKMSVRPNETALFRWSLAPLCRKLAVSDTQFFVDLHRYSSSKKSAWVREIKEVIQKLGLAVSVVEGDLNRFNSSGSVGHINLLGVLKRNDNPFAHENSVLMLLLSALDSDGAFESDIDLPNCKVGCEDWSRLTSLEPAIEITFSHVDGESLYPVPDWVKEDSKPLYRAGMFLRSCLVGNVDWTNSKLLRSGNSGYRGVKSSFYKRQLGMNHAPEFLQGETTTMTSWLSGLLFQLLQSPGSDVANGSYSWPGKWSLKELRKIIVKRVEYQKGMFCWESGIPAYVEKLKLDWCENKKDLNVVMVQSLLPKKKDFLSHGILLDSPKYRARHRRHVAAVAELILHKIFSQRSINDEIESRKSDVDLIVWPELSISIDDIDVLRRLSDKTGAIIHAGLTFRNVPGIDGPNNTSIWLVPKRVGWGRQFMVRIQGKKYMMKDEVGFVKPWRPYQLMLELIHPALLNKKGFVLTGSICYDATDIKLSSDLKGKSNAYLIPALNQDVATFDSMVDALYYHMYQHVVLVNTGEFGGSVAKAPYKEKYDKLITHVHGAEQVSISTFSMNMFDFRDVGKHLRSGKEVKTRPAG